MKFYKNLQDNISRLIHHFWANTTILVFLILVLALFVRLIQINDPFVEMFSWRESSTAMMAHNLFSGKTTLLYPEVNWGGPGPNYQGRELQVVTYIAAKLYSVFGEKEWVARLVSVFFGLLGIVAIFGIVYEVWDKESAILTAFLLAVIPGNVYLQRCFLPGPAMVSLVSLGLYFSILYFKHKKNSYLILAAVTGCLGVLVKINGLIIGLPLAYILFVSFRKKEIRKPDIIKLSAALFIVLSLVVSYYLWARYLSLNYPPYHFAGSGKFVSVHNIAKWIENGYFLKNLYYHLTKWVLSEVVLFLYVVGFFITPAKNKSFYWVFHFWVFANIIQFIIEADHFVYDSNNLLIFIPPAAAFSSVVLVKIKNMVVKVANYQSGMRVLIVGLAILCLFSFMDIKSFYSDIYKSHYKVGLKLKELAEKGDLVISLDKNPVTIYYSGLNGWTFPPAYTWKDGYNVDHGENDVALLKKHEAEGAKWIVMTKRRSSYTGSMNILEIENNFPQLYNYLNSNYSIYWSSEDGIIFKSIGNHSHMTSD